MPSTAPVAALWARWAVRREASEAPTRVVSGSGGRSMAKKSLLENALPIEVQCTILWEAEEHFLHEIMESDEERQLLLESIRRLRRQLRLA